MKINHVLCKIKSKKYLLSKIQNDKKNNKNEILRIIKNTRYEKDIYKNLKNEVHFLKKIKNEENFCKHIKYLNLMYNNIFSEYINNLLLEMNLLKNINSYYSIMYFLRSSKIPAQIKVNILKYKKKDIMYYDIIKNSLYQLLRN